MAAGSVLAGRTDRVRVWTQPIGRRRPVSKALSRKAPPTAIRSSFQETRPRTRPVSHAHAPQTRSGEEGDRVWGGGDERGATGSRTAAVADGQ